MTMAAAAAPPARMHLVDLVTGEDHEVQFNPEQIQEELAVNYARLTIPGMSHQQLQYINTGNHGLTLDLYSVGHTQELRASLDDWRRFLLSLCYPTGDAGTIDDGAPPRVLFVWPHVYTFTAAILNYRGVISQFAQTGHMSRLLATLQLEEIRDVRLTSADVRRQGTRRTVSGSTP